MSQRMDARRALLRSAITRSGEDLADRAGRRPHLKALIPDFPRPVCAVEVSRFDQEVHVWQ